MQTPETVPRRSATRNFPANHSPATTLRIPMFLRFTLCYISQTSRVFRAIIRRDVSYHAINK